MNIGTQIEQLMKSQGFDYADYGRASAWTTKIGLELTLWGYTDKNTKVAVNRNADGNYHIDINPTHSNHAPSIVQDNISEENLFQTFKKQMAF